MTWKSDLLRDKIKKSMNSIVRGLLAEKLSITDMKAFLLFYDYGLGYSDIAVKLDLPDWKDAKTKVNRAYSELNDLYGYYTFVESDYISFPDDEYIDEDLDD